MSDSPKRSLDPSITAAIIGVIGTIIVTVITIYANRPAPPPTAFPPTAIIPTNTAAPTAIPTDTVPIGEPTSTPAPATDTPAPTFTFTPIPSVQIGEDWPQGCISSSWRPYSSKEPVAALSGDDGCLLQPVTGFFAENGRLSFLYEDRLSSAEVHGMFAPLPPTGSASVYISLKDLDTSDIWIGVFAEPSIDSQGLLMTIPSGNVSSRPFAQWEMPGQERVLTTAVLNQGSGYGLRFDFTPASIKATVLPNVFASNTYPISSNQKWLFLGYQARNGTNRIEAYFFDLSVVEQ